MDAMNRKAIGICAGVLVGGFAAIMLLGGPSPEQRRREAQQEALRLNEDAIRTLPGTTLGSVSVGRGVDSLRVGSTQLGSFDSLVDAAYAARELGTNPHLITRLHGSYRVHDLSFGHTSGPIDVKDVTRFGKETRAISIDSSLPLGSSPDVFIQNGREVFGVPQGAVGYGLLTRQVVLADSASHAGVGVR